MRSITFAGKFVLRRGFGMINRLSGRDHRIIAAYLRGPGPKKLQIGCGGHPVPGWLNSSYPVSARRSSRRNRIVRLDATRAFPFPDALFDYVWSEHMIEHVPYRGGSTMLRECFRVLRPGGRLRLSTPDLQFILDLLTGPLDKRQLHYVEWAARQFLPHGVPATPVSVVNNFVRNWGHQFIYDRETMVDLLQRTGFVDVVSCVVNQSEDPHLRGIDCPERMPEGFLELETMTFEARKPLN